MNSPGWLNPKLKPTEKVTVRNICWAAGIFEAEGILDLPKNSNSNRIHVVQKDKWLPNRLRSLFGGSLYELNRRQCSGLFQWSCSGARARGFLQSIYCLLSPRRQKQVRENLARGAIIKDTEPHAIKGPDANIMHWVAGIFEGDGCSFRNHNTEVVSITQKNEWLGDKLKLLFGGSINKQELNTWLIYGTQARGFLQTIYCLLSPRRQEQIRKVLKV